MEELFNKPVSTQNLYAIFEYIFNNDMTQELFELCCEKGITQCLFNEFCRVRSFVKAIKELDQLRYQKYEKYKLIDISKFTRNLSSTVCVSYDLKCKIDEYCQWNDRKVESITDDEINRLKGDNDFWCKCDANHYEICLNIIKTLKDLN
eukprot:gene8454-279_t